jgi:hypothetical protein
MGWMHLASVGFTQSHLFLGGEIGKPNPATPAADAIA